MQTLSPSGPKVFTVHSVDFVSGLLMGGHLAAEAVRGPRAPASLGDIVTTDRQLREARTSTVTDSALPEKLTTH